MTTTSQQAPFFHPPHIPPAPGGQHALPQPAVQPLAPPAQQQQLTPFLKDLWALIGDPRTNSVIEWSKEAANAFVIKDRRMFEELLPQTTHIKHTNFDSFTRQLNLYGFKKYRKAQSGDTWSHQFLDPGQIYKIKRKDSKSQKKVEQMGVLERTVAMLLNRVDTLEQELFIAKSFLMNQEKMRSQFETSMKQYAHSLIEHLFSKMLSAAFGGRTNAQTSHFDINCQDGTQQGAPKPIPHPSNDGSTPFSSRCLPETEKQNFANPSEPIILPYSKLSPSPTLRSNTTSQKHATSHTPQANPNPNTHPARNPTNPTSTHQPSQSIRNNSEQVSGHQNHQFLQEHGSQKIRGTDFSSQKIHRTGLGLNTKTEPHPGAGGVMSSGSSSGQFQMDQNVAVMNSGSNPNVSLPDAKSMTDIELGPIENFSGSKDPFSYMSLDLNPPSHMAVATPPVSTLTPNTGLNLSTSSGLSLSQSDPNLTTSSGLDSSSFDISQSTLGQGSGMVTEENDFLVETDLRQLDSQDRVGVGFSSDNQSQTFGGGGPSQDFDSIRRSSKRRTFPRNARQFSSGVQRINQPPPHGLERPHASSNNTRPQLLPSPNVGQHMGQTKF